MTTTARAGEADGDESMALTSALLRPLVDDSGIVDDEDVDGLDESKMPQAVDCNESLKLPFSSSVIRPEAASTTVLQMEVLTDNLWTHSICSTPEPGSIVATASEYPDKLVVNDTDAADQCEIAHATNSAETTIRPKRSGRQRSQPLAGTRVRCAFEHCKGWFTCRFDRFDHWIRQRSLTRRRHAQNVTSTSPLVALSPRVGI